MKCPRCQSDNPETQKFCGDCGTQLTLADKSEVSLTKTLQTPVSDLIEGTLFAGRYEILHPLGIGGMGRVYKVRDTKIDEDMALKVLRPEIAADNDIIERFKNELKLARRIGHRNICRAYDLHVEGTTPFITMEFVEGEDLRSFIKNSGKLTPDMTIRIARQIAQGLKEAKSLLETH